MVGKENILSTKKNGHKITYFVIGTLLLKERMKALLYWKK